MAGYVVKEKMASFLAGASTASFLGFYLLHNDYKVAHDSVSQQMKCLHGTLDGRISTLEKLGYNKASKHAEVAE